MHSPRKTNSIGLSTVAGPNSNIRQTGHALTGHYGCVVTKHGTMFVRPASIKPELRAELVPPAIEHQRSNGYLTWSPRVMSDLIGFQCLSAACHRKMRQGLPFDARFLGRPHSEPSSDSACFPKRPSRTRIALFQVQDSQGDQGSLTAERPLSP